MANVFKYLRDYAMLGMNRRLGREFIRTRPSFISIEPTSYCNLNCRFCAYPKKEHPKRTMSLAFFSDCIEQAVEMGYDSFGLTPCTGDIFMDKGIWDKFGFLEKHGAVGGYGFYTNFTLLTPAKIDRLIELGKLQWMSISLYGHDAESFVSIAAASEKNFSRLITNLEHLLKRLPDVRFNMQMGLRTVRRFDRHSGALMDVVLRLRKAGIRRLQINHAYNNWGGLVSADDVRGLDMRIGGPDWIYKNGPCARLFDDFQIMADGTVNGCACRDANATLRLGDLNRTKLKEILNPRNEAYLQLIAEQDRGEFRDICKNCDFYRSTYSSRRATPGSREAFFDALAARSSAAGKPAAGQT